jgi:hypothetical protein
MFSIAAQAKIKNKVWIRLLEERGNQERGKRRGGPCCRIQIPKGKVGTYKKITEKIGMPRAYWAVGNAFHKEETACTNSAMSCVVRSDSGFGGERKGRDFRAILGVKPYHLVYLICFKWGFIWMLGKLPKTLWNVS